MWKNSRCLESALQLMEEHNSKGRIFFVRSIEDEFVNQTVYVPEEMLNQPSKWDKLTPLNQRDKGYNTKMTLAQVMRYGIELKWVYSRKA